MATSGSYDFSVTRDNIIVDAYGAIGVGDEGEAISGDMSVRAARLLNMIVQQLSGRSDRAPNMKMWTREHATLFIQKSQSSYDLGPATTDDYACHDSEIVSTTLSASASAGASTLTVTSITGMADGDFILTMLSSGSWDQNTINGTPSGSTVTLTNTLGGAAASGAQVYVFTNRIQKPLDILMVNRRDESGDDCEMNKLFLKEYFRLPDKDQTGEPTSWYYEEKLSNGKLYLDSAPNNALDLIKFVYLRPIQDFDAATDNAEFPKVWYRALVYMLAVDLAVMLGIPVSQELKELKGEAMEIARNEDPDEVLMFFEPGRD